jgi:hypothetical protein
VAWASYLILRKKNKPAGNAQSETCDSPLDAKKVSRFSYQAFKPYLAYLITISILIVLACAGTVAWGFGKNVKSIFAPVFAPAPLHWNTFETNSFSIKMPKTPSLQNKVVNTPAGEIAVNIYTATTKDKAYSVAHSIYPETVLASSIKDRLDGSRDGALKNTNAELLSETILDLDGIPGREFRLRFSVADQVSVISTVRLFLIRTELYMIQVIPLNEKVGYLEDDFMFLQSFKIIPIVSDNELSPKPPAEEIEP